MPESDFGIRSIADQRYYHFVVLRDHGGFGFGTYWKRVGDVLAPTNSVACAGKRYVVQHRKMRSANAYARGAVAYLLSEKGNGRPPFLYDLFAAKVDLRDGAYFLLGFPFVGLASDVVGGLLARGVIKTDDLLGVDVPKLVDVMERGIDDRFEHLSTRVVGLQFVVTDDKSLTAVRLGGDDPLSAEVYVGFLRKKVSGGVVRPDLCVLACEREWRAGEQDGQEEPRALRSRLRVDGHGNFRFYAHVGCTNLRLFPYAVGQLRGVGCLRKTSGNPLLRLGREEME